MKIRGSGGVSNQPASRGARAEGGFSVPGAARSSSPAAATPVSGAASVGSVAALMALQEVDTVEERRRKAIRRGSGLLDRLDALKVAMLDGGGGASALQALARAVAEDRTEDEDAGLKDVLDHIETRAAVELAKARMR